MIYIDLETTGFDGDKEDIIEIFLLKDDENGNKVGSLYFLIKPSQPITLFISELTKITNAIVEDKKSFKEVAQDIIDFIGNEILVGHNINLFDLPFLNKNFIKNGFPPLNNKTIDTIELARNINGDGKYSKGYKLIDLCLKYNIHFDAAKFHGAEYDVLLTKELYLILVNLR